MLSLMISQNVCKEQFHKFFLIFNHFFSYAFMFCLIPQYNMLLLQFSLRFDHFAYDCKYLTIVVVSIRVWGNRFARCIHGRKLFYKKQDDATKTGFQQLIKRKPFSYFWWFWPWPWPNAIPSKVSITTTTFQL